MLHFCCDPTALFLPCRQHLALPFSSGHRRPFCRASTAFLPYRQCLNPRGPHQVGGDVLVEGMAESSGAVVVNQEMLVVANMSTQGGVTMGSAGTTIELLGSVHVQAADSADAPLLSVTDAGISIVRASGASVSSLSLVDSVSARLPAVFTVPNARRFSARAGKQADRDRRRGLPRRRQPRRRGLRPSACARCVRDSCCPAAALSLPFHGADLRDFLCCSLTAKRSSFSQRRWSRTRPSPRRRTFWSSAHS